ncbi:hypothetical protein OURE66S_02594 [Oligella ureolytica]
MSQCLSSPVSCRYCALDGVGECGDTDHNELGPKHVSATRATLIYAGEPVWGGVIGRLYGERLPALAFVGAALIVLGVIVSEVRFKKPKAFENIDNFMLKGHSLINKL